MIISKQKSEFVQIVYRVITRCETDRYYSFLHVFNFFFPSFYTQKKKKLKTVFSLTHDWIGNVQRRHAGTSAGHRLVVERTGRGHDAERIGAFGAVHVFQHGVALFFADSFVFADEQIRKTKHVQNLYRKKKKIVLNK